MTPPGTSLETRRIRTLFYLSSFISTDFRCFKGYLAILPLLQTLFGVGGIIILW